MSPSRAARVVHPCCDCRAPEAALAFALALASTRRDVWLACSQKARERIELLVERQVPCAKVTARRVQVMDASIWLEEPPTATIGAVVVADAHALPESPLEAAGSRLADPDSVIVLSEPLPRGHWARSIEVVARLDAARVREDFSDAVRVLDLYPGASDVSEADVQRSPFTSFARKRLRVRTDKSREFLTARQQTEAEEQLGGAWHTGRSGTPTVSFELSAMQKRYVARKRLAVAQGKPPRFLLLKYRRGGFTTLEQALSYYECATAPGVECATLAHTRDDTARIFEITKRFLDCDPEKLKRVDDSRSKISMENGSSIFTGTAGGHGFARGATLRRVHGSEVAQWCLGPNQAHDVDVLVAGLVGAASHGEVVLESTPNGVEWFCQTYRDAKRGLNDWTPIFLPWYEDPANRAATGTFDAEEVSQTLDEEEKALVARRGLDPAQVAWRRQEKRRYGRLFKQECPEDDESCFLTSGTCYFSVDVALRLLKEAPEPIHAVEHRGFRETRWEQPERGVEYVAGCDTSEGIPGCDPNGVGVMRRDTGAQVASIHGYLSPAALAEQAARLCREYNDALLGVERQNHGHAVLQKLRDLGFDRPHYHGGSLYYFHRGAELASSRPGWDTNSESRPRMLAELAEALESSVQLGRTRWARDRDFLAECLSFRLQNSGKFEADPGAHDDSVMKWAIAWQMRQHRMARPSLRMM